MGDRTHVSLTILKTHAPKFEEILDQLKEGADSSHVDTKLEVVLITYEFDEVNYGELYFLSRLEQEGIPFSSRWMGGGDYGPGEEHARYTPKGELVTHHVDDTEYGLCPISLRKILLDPHTTEAQKFATLVNQINDHHADVEPLPWDKQEEYAKLFLTRKLISQE